MPTSSRRIHRPTRLEDVDRARFWSQVDVEPSGCWYWLGPINGKGYGVYGRWMAHRLAYTIVKGPIPDDLTLDHTCRNRSCLNPDHLEAVTNTENIRRGIAAAASEKGGSQKDPD